MNKKASIMQVLVLMVTVVLTSGLILLLVNTGIITVKAQSNEPILNTEFIPLGREGSLVIKEFKFCENVDELYNCENPKDSFTRGDKVYFRFVVESSTYNGDVMLVENYQVRDADGKVVLSVDETKNFNYDAQSSEGKEDIFFKDNIVSDLTDPAGTYTLDLIIENPLLNKQVTLSKELALE